MAVSTTAQEVIDRRRNARATGAGSYTEMEDILLLLADAVERADGGGAVGDVAAEIIARRTAQRQFGRLPPWLMEDELILVGELTTHLAG